VKFLLRSYDAGKCCLCGAPGTLTGEHKIKLSALRHEFGNAPLYIGNPANSPKLAQSPKSKLFHFSGKICSECNGAKTQKADRSFHEFHLLVKESIQNSQYEHWKNGIFHHPNFLEGSEIRNYCFVIFPRSSAAGSPNRKGQFPSLLQNTPSVSLTRTGYGCK
jgi:hypothetical protein